MKRPISLLSILSFTMFFGQEGRVGINTTTPKTTMDVNGKTNALGVSLPTDMTGFQAPRLTLLELTNKGSIYGADQEGALIYITSLAGGNTLLSRANIDTIGYYYFDGAFWVKLVITSENPTVTASNGLTKTADNIKLGGTLIENTTIANAGFNTLITGNGNVGIGVTDPSQKLDISGTLRARGVQELAFSSTDRLMAITTNGYVKKVSLATLFIPKTALVGTRTTATGNIAANTTQTVIFTANPLISGFTYNSTNGRYTAAESGYYQITTTVNKDFSMNNPTGGTSYINIEVNGNTANAMNTGYLNGTQESSQNMTYVVYLNANDYFTISTSYTRTSAILTAQVSVIAMGG